MSRATNFGAAGSGCGARTAGRVPTVIVVARPGYRSALPPPAPFALATLCREARG